MSETIVKFKDGVMYEYEIYDLVPNTDPVLHRACEPFDFSNPPLPTAKFAVSMAETMGAKGGIGLAAPQVGFPYRVIAIALVEGNQDSKTWDVITLFNPKIVSASEKKVLDYEGCLSFPKLSLEVERHDEVEVEYQNSKGEVIRGRFVGIDARCVQHEIDHLNGVCFTDGMSKLKLDRAKKKAEKRIKRLAQRVMVR